MRKREIQCNFFSKFGAIFKNILSVVFRLDNLLLSSLVVIKGTFDPFHYWKKETILYLHCFKN